MDHPFRCDPQSRLIPVTSGCAIEHLGGGQLLAAGRACLRHGRKGAASRRPPSARRPRRFDPDAGFARQEWDIESIATLEFLVPSSWLGGAGKTDLFGRPALDLQIASKPRRQAGRARPIARGTPGSLSSRGALFDQKPASPWAIALSLRGCGNGKVEVDRAVANETATHPPACSSLTVLRRGPKERMMSFSASTTRKNTKPPSTSQGQTHNGMASTSNRNCNGGA